MNLKNIAFWVMIIFVFILGGYLVHTIHTQSFACLTNPYNFSMSLLDKANNANVTCICSTNKFGQPPIIWDHNGFRSFNAFLNDSGKIVS